MTWLLVAYAVGAAATVVAGQIVVTRELRRVGILVAGSPFMLFWFYVGFLIPLAVFASIWPISLPVYAGARRVIGSLSRRALLLHPDGEKMVDFVDKAFDEAESAEDERSSKPDL